MQSAVELVSGAPLATLAMRRLLGLAAALVFVAGIQLYVLSEHTATFFAWTIEPPLTAAFLGGAYWASSSLEWLAARERLWARARIAVPAVLVFTTLTLVATLLHLDRFHFGAADMRTMLAAWAWLGVYMVVPPVMLFVLLRQMRVRMPAVSMRRPLPEMLRVGFAAQAAVLLAVGAALFVVPEATLGHWPWALTDLSARAIGAWLLGLGLCAAHLVGENDLERVQPACASAALLGGLQLIALVRFAADVAWTQPQAWLYVAFLITLLATGACGVWWKRRAPAAHAC
jgi:hypothetical protein